MFICVFVCVNVSSLLSSGSVCVCSMYVCVVCVYVCVCVVVVYVIVCMNVWCSVVLMFFL